MASAVQHGRLADRRGVDDARQQRTTSKGLPDAYGTGTVEPHDYQSPQGGANVCPLGRDARIIVSSTPKFATMASSEYAEFGSARVQHDRCDDHGRTIPRCPVQNVADAVATVAMVKEAVWSYHLPKMEMPPVTVALNLYGNCTFACEDDWRETIMGTISSYDRECELQYTNYLAATHEHGKATFLGRSEAEVVHLTVKCPKVQHIGIADGPKGEFQILWNGIPMPERTSIGMRRSTPWAKRRQRSTEANPRRGMRGWTRVIMSSSLGLGRYRRS